MSKRILLRVVPVKGTERNSLHLNSRIYHLKNRCSNGKLWFLSSMQNNDFRNSSHCYKMQIMNITSPTVNIIQFESRRSQFSAPFLRGQLNGTKFTSLKTDLFVLVVHVCSNHKSLYWTGQICIILISNRS